MRTKESWVLAGKRGSPLALIPGLGWGRVEVPPESLPFGHVMIP